MGLNAHHCSYLFVRKSLEHRKPEYITISFWHFVYHPHHLFQWYASYILDFVISKREVIALAELVLLEIVGIHQHNRDTGVLFQLVTLPVEFDASRRALVMLQDYGILGQNEVQGSRAVLNAAALTYVASAAASVLQLLRLLMIVNNGRRRR